MLILSVGLIILGIYYIYKQVKQDKELGSNDGLEGKITLNKEKVLKKGSSGAEVSELQRLLKKQYNAYLGTSGINGDGVDGDFGTKTETALKDAKGVTEISLNNFK